ncbi:MAG: TniQ family protein [Rhizobiales bacterium]|nr:TniQ family protein [Hyphomicrobiales bacterium]
MNDGRLPLWVVPAKDEPAHGILLRLAERNGIQNIRFLSYMTGLRVSQLRGGKGIDRLARILRCEPDAFMHSTFVCETRGFASVRGERLNFISDLDQTKRRACPRCIAKSAHHRFWWDLSFVTTCPEHAINLVDVCSCGGTLSWKDVSIRKCCQCHVGSVSDIPASPADSAVLAMDRWTLGRLGVGRRVSVPALDRMSMTTAIKIVQHVGALEIGGYRIGQQRPDGFDVPMNEVRLAGFKIMQQGRLDEILDKTHNCYLETRKPRSGKSKMSPTVRTAYGWFGAWFKVWHRSKFFEESSAPFANIILANAARKSIPY